MDTKGPEVRTAMLRDHKNISLVKDQDIIIEAVGDSYTTFEGYKTEEETRIGLSYGKLCQSVKAGNRILIADGTIVIQVVEILSETTLKGKVLNSKELGERKNCNLPGVVVDIPVLTPHDINDVQNFCAKHKMDFIAASFVQSGNDVRFIRKILDEAGGFDVKIISKIENEARFLSLNAFPSSVCSHTFSVMAGMENLDEIIRETDGIMVARGDLGMEIPSERVPLAQKMMISKCNIAGKFVITATQMLESMCNITGKFVITAMLESMCKNPLPTRAEMTDVANAVFDGTDAVMLSGETANGAFPDTAVAIMSAIVANAEKGINRDELYNFTRNWTPKPMSFRETITSSACQSDLL
ncbi:Pyruvate/Phosphoenolpyruvate kinase-like domain-containing protein [Baffinella frigidus]|nr:Pyruvate/Phosphoenolpyruvate kinase-like domain-containing protein [Cryptophyta sp. CCMP2293]